MLSLLCRWKTYAWLALTTSSASVPPELSRHRYASVEELQALGLVLHLTRVERRLAIVCWDPTIENRSDCATIIAVPPADYGGTELFLAHLAEGLQQLGLEVVVADREERVVVDRVALRRLALLGLEERRPPVPGPEIQRG